MTGSKAPLLRRLLHLPISRRLPAVTMAMAGMIALMGAVLYQQSYRNSMTEIETTLGILARDEVAQVTGWYDMISRDLLVAAAEPASLTGLRELSSASKLDGGMTGAQAAYVTANPHPLGQRQALLDAQDGSAYSAVHRRVHPRLDKMRQLLGFYDMFLFDADGTLLYTVVKEADFGEDFVNGPYADTGLGVAFRAALASADGEVAVADFTPYAPSADAPAAFLATPIHDAEGRVVGVLAAQVSVEALSASLATSDLLGDRGDMFLVGDDGRARTRSRFADRFIEYGLLPDLPYVADLRAGQTGLFHGVAGISGAPSIVQTETVPIPFGNWTLVIELDEAEHLATIMAFRQRVLVFVALGLAAGVLLGLVASRSITRPLSSVLRSIDDVAGGNYAAEVPVAERSDEIGTLGRSVVAFRDTLAAAQAQEAKRQRDFGAQEAVTQKMTLALEALARGDLTCTLVDRFPYGFEPMRKNFNATLDSLRDIMGEVVQQADEINARGETIASATLDLSRRTENQAATLEETAAALDQLTTSVRSAAESAAEVENVVTQTRDVATVSGRVVQEAVGAMSEIKRSSDNISRIISVIEDISFQTNLLALNAGVEAARAGEAGRGFAVVASEVRALSQRSSEAAKEIKQLISNSSEQVEKGVSLVNRAGETLSGILDRVGNVADLVSGIANSAREQSLGLGEINVGVIELDKVTQRNTEMVEEATAASGALKDRAAGLKGKIAWFKTERPPEAGVAEAA